MAEQNLAGVSSKLAYEDLTADAMPKQVGLKSERIKSRPDCPQTPIWPLSEPVPVDVLVFSLAEVIAEFLEQSLRNVELTPTLRVANRFTVALVDEP